MTITYRKDFNVRDSVFILLSLIALSYSILRSNNLSFTHDEALTYTIVKDNSDWKYTANNHLLNTYLMKISAFFFSNSELALRLPNVLAHFFYLVITFYLVRQFKTYYFQIFAFIFLNFNLALLEFFSVARGYGISHTLLLASLFLLGRFIDEKSKEITKNAYFSIFLGGLSVLVNLTLLNYVVALLVTILLVYFLNNKNSPDTSFKFKNWVNPLPKLILPSTIFIGAILMWIFYLKEKGELYFGGKGLIASVFESLLSYSLYGMRVPVVAGYIIGIAAFLSAVVLTRSLIMDFFSDRKPTFHSSIWLILILTLFFSVIQNTVLKTPYPTDRTALFYLVLMPVTLVLSLNKYLYENLWKRLVALGFVFALAISISLVFFLRANLFSTLSYSDDACSKEMMRDLSCITNCSEPIWLGVSWVFEPSSNFYRERNQFEGCLNVVSRDGVSKHLYDYYYCFVNDTIQILERKDLKVVKYYPETNTLLLTRRARQKILKWQKEIDFSALLPPNGITEYSEKSVALPPIAPKDYVRIEIYSDGELLEDMKAHIILLEPSNWQNTLVFHNQLIGTKTYHMQYAINDMPSPVIIYRNWQSKLALPSIKLKIKVYR